MFPDSGNTYACWHLRMNKGPEVRETHRLASIQVHDQGSLIHPIGGNDLLYEQKKSSFIPFEWESMTYAEPIGRFYAIASD